jgi:sigma-B regulation protein RsbU (phosphoserine phosphatase)
MRRTLAIAFAAAQVLYATTWMYVVRAPEKSSFPFDISAGRVSQVHQATPLRPGDRVISLDGQLLTDTVFFGLLYTRSPGDVIRVEVEGRAGVDVRLGPPRPRVGGGRVSLELARSYPVLFLVVGLAVLFLRQDSAHAWRLALFFAAILAQAPLLFAEWVIPVALRRFMLTYHTVFHPLLPATAYLFFATFPAHSPLDRRAPWLKGALLGGTLAVTLPLAGAVLWSGASDPIWAVARLLPPGRFDALLEAFLYAGVLLSLWSLSWNLRAGDNEVCKKTRVALLGTAVGCLPYLLALLAASLRGVRPESQWFYAPAVVLSSALPLSIAYAVVKQRVLDVPVLLRRSARYLLVQRGLAIAALLAGIVVTALFTWIFANWLEEHVMTAAVPSGVALGVMFGLVLAWSGSRAERRITERLDRAFFRGAYDARNILHSLAEKAPAATTAPELADLLLNHVAQALHPKSVAVFFSAADGSFHPASFLGPSPPIAIDAEPAALLAQSDDLRLPGPECVIPLKGREQRLVGLILLGERLSEEPYSGEDLRLLAAVAAQAGAAVENIRLAEEIAERLAAERRAEREVEIASLVQRRLFPQKKPPVPSLDYAGACIQARGVGGDFYDYLDMGENRIGLVLSDIVGKGIASSLLMASLQANLRSQYALALADLPGMLQSVNRVFFESTLPHQYATLFIGCYDHTTRLLRYANCGHNPPWLVRAAGTAHPLTATATVLGMFDKWESEPAAVHLAPGDVLVAYSDGVSEAFSDRGEEYGEQRLLQSILRWKHLSAELLLKELTGEVMSFTGRIQEDDVTLLVVKAA